MLCVILFSMDLFHNIHGSLLVTNAWGLITFLYFSFSGFYFIISNYVNNSTDYYVRNSPPYYIFYFDCSFFSTTQSQIFYKFSISIDINYRLSSPLRSSPLITAFVCRSNEYSPKSVWLMDFSLLS